MMSTVEQYSPMKKVSLLLVSVSACLFCAKPVVIIISPDSAFNVFLNPAGCTCSVFVCGVCVCVQCVCVYVCVCVVCVCVCVFVHTCALAFKIQHFIIQNQALFFVFCCTVFFTLKKRKKKYDTISFMHLLKKKKQLCFRNVSGDLCRSCTQCLNLKLIKESESVLN